MIFKVVTKNQALGWLGLIWFILIRASLSRLNLFYFNFAYSSSTQLNLI